MSISHHIIDGIDIYIGCYDDIDGSLSAAQLADINSLKIEKRRRERALTYTLINRAATTNPRYTYLSGAPLLHHPNGAPYLNPTPIAPEDLNDANNLNSPNLPISPIPNSSLLIPNSISLSHCRTAACIALSPDANARIGIDIEDYSDRLHKAASKFINETDEKALAAFTARISPKGATTISPQPPVGMHPGASAQSLLLAWTIKEAVYKAAGIDSLTLRDGITIHTLTFSSTPQLINSSTRAVTAADIPLHCISLLTQTRCLTVAVK